MCHLSSVFITVSIIQKNYFKIEKKKTKNKKNKQNAHKTILGWVINIDKADLVGLQLRKISIQVICCSERLRAAVSTNRLTNQFKNLSKFTLTFTDTSTRCISLLITPFRGRGSYVMGLRKLSKLYKWLKVLLGDSLMIIKYSRG